MLPDGSDLTVMTTTVPTFELFSQHAADHAGGALAQGGIAAGSDGYAVLSYQLATEVLRNPRFANSALRLMEEFGISNGPVHGFRARSIIMQDGAQQLRLRTPLARFMGPATVQNTREVLTEIVQGIFDDVDDTKPVDFHSSVDRRIPSLVYCHLAGAPQSDAPKVQELSERTLALLARDPSLKPDILAAYDELFQYLQDLMQRKRQAGLGEDMLSHLMTLADDGKLTAQELFDEATSMLEASSVNTGHQIGLVVWNLLGNREVWREIVADPSWIPAAVMEALRLYPRTGVISKIAEEEIEVGGTTIPAGADVHVAVWSANRDPERFENPGEFILGRERNQPLTFSTGPHNCLGQGLAKVEIEEVVGYLARHYPNARVVDDATTITRTAGRWTIKQLTVETGTRAEDTHDI